MASFTPALLRPLGVRLSIYPAKGVTVTVPAAAWPDGPQVPIIDDTRLFGLIRLGDRYRCSGLGRVHRLGRDPESGARQGDRRQRHRRLPAIRQVLRSGDRLVWSGLRPMPSSGNPYLGATPIKNLYLNCGHGHLGWTMSCGSSQRGCRYRLGPPAGDRHDRPDPRHPRLRLELTDGQERPRDGEDDCRTAPSSTAIRCPIPISRAVRAGDFVITSAFGDRVPLPDEQVYDARGHAALDRRPVAGRSPSPTRSTAPSSS